MTRPIALVDLDDTLFQTRRKCPDDVAEAALTPLGFAGDGSALSFATPRQMTFLRWLANSTRLIPVTARSLDALRRVRIDFTVAVCAHGGVILDENGQPDADWHAHIAGAAAGDRGALAAMTAAICEAAAAADQPVAARIVEQSGTALYVLAKHASADGPALHALVDSALPVLPAGWTRHRNGNNVALLPPWLGKQHAVAHLLPALRAAAPEAPVIGIGDSDTDAAFLRLCDFAMLPGRSQLGRMLDGL